MTVMRKYFFILLLCSSAMMAQNTYSDYQAFRKGVLGSYDSFRETILENYAEYLAAVFVFKRAVMHAKAQALVKRPDHELQGQLLAARHRQAPRVAVVEHLREGRVLELEPALGKLVPAVEGV